MYIKILKNTTISPISLDELGLPPIPASGQIEIQVFDFQLLADIDSTNYLDPLITSGSIVVNNGITDLSAEEGKRYIKWIPALNIQENSVNKGQVPYTLNFENATVSPIDANGKVTITAGTATQDQQRLVEAQCHTINGCEIYSESVQLFEPDTTQGLINYLKEEVC